MAKLRTLVYLGFLSCCAIGCAEFRHDSANFGGYYLTSLVEHVGHRNLNVQNVYLSEDLVVAEANLTQPTRNKPEVVGTRFLVASRQYVDSQVENKFSRQKGGKISVPTWPLVDSHIDQVSPALQGWVLWPNTLGKLEKDPSIEDFQQLTKGKLVNKHTAVKVPYLLNDRMGSANFYYPQYVDTASFWQEHEYLIYRPIATGLFKWLVVPPAMIVDTACLPAVGIVYVIAMLRQPWDHGP